VSRKVAKIAKKKTIFDGIKGKRPRRQRNDRRVRALAASMGHSEDMLLHLRGEEERGSSLKG